MHFQTFRRRVRNEEFVNSSASTPSFRDSYSSSPEFLKGKCFLESAPRRNEACVYANTAQSVISSTKEFAIFRWNTRKRQTDRRRREEERGKKGERENQKATNYEQNPLREIRVLSWLQASDTNPTSASRFNASSPL